MHGGKHLESTIALSFFLALFCVSSLTLNQARAENQEPLTVQVARQNVNLRAKPSLAAEVVAQVSHPEILTVKSLTDEWVEIQPPDHAELWVLGDYVQEGVIQCERRVNIRAGAGINFNIVGQLQNGDKVEVRGTHTDWIKIAPPETASLWVAKSMVEIISPSVPEPEPEPEPEPITPEPEPEPEPEPQPEPEPITPEPEPEPKPAIQPPTDLNLNYSMPQGEWKEYEGVLRPRSFLIGAPSRYRLTSDSDGGAITICYVRGNEAQLRTLLNRHMKISGREYWIHRLSHPVLIPERIVLK